MFSCSSLPQLLLQRIWVPTWGWQIVAHVRIWHSAKMSLLHLWQSSLSITAFFPFGHRPGLSIAHQNKQDWHYHIGHSGTVNHTPTKYHFQWLAKNWRNVLKKRTIIPNVKNEWNQFSFILLFKAVVLKFSSTSELPGELAFGSLLQSSVGLGWDLRICISNTLRFTIQKNTVTNAKYVKLKIFWQAK